MYRPSQAGGGGGGGLKLPMPGLSPGGHLLVGLRLLSYWNLLLLFLGVHCRMDQTGHLLPNLFLLLLLLQVDLLLLESWVWYGEVSTSLDKRLD